MNLGLYLYNVLTHNEQAKILVEHGLFLMGRKENDLTVSLYGLFNFYVELHNDPESNKIKTFKSIIPLQP